MTAGASTLVVIVNFRTPKLTVQCLRSVAAQRGRTKGIRVVVVENGSGDSSAAEIGGAIEREGWGGWCELLVSERNLGFAGGNNLGIRWAWKRDAAAGRDRAGYVLLLNSDTIVHEGCLARCLDLMGREERIGAMSCKLLNGDGSLQVVSRKFMSPLRLMLGATGLPWKLPRMFGWAQTEYRGWDMERDAGDAEWIGGAFMLLRTSVLEKVGLLDDDFFFYGEDAELCFRIRLAGWRVRYDPSSTTTHLGGSSSDPTRMVSEAKSKAMWRARYLFVRKCYGRAAMWLVRTVDAGAVSMRRAAMAVVGRGGTTRAEQLRITQRVVLGRLGPL